MLARAPVSWQDALPAPRQIPSRPQSLTAAHALVRQILKPAWGPTHHYVMCYVSTSRVARMCKSLYARILEAFFISKLCLRLALLHTSGLSRIPLLCRYQ